MVKEKKRRNELKQAKDSKLGSGRTVTRGIAGSCTPTMRDEISHSVVRSFKPAILHFPWRVYNSKVGEKAGQEGGSTFFQAGCTWGVIEAKGDANWLIRRYPGCADHVGTWAFAFPWVFQLWGQERAMVTLPNVLPLNTQRPLEITEEK